MSQKNFALIAGVLFSLIAVLHLMRIVYGWEARINGGNLPMWVSWIALAVAACLGYQGITLSKKR